MIEIVRCSWCNAEMPAERLEYYDTCVKCTDQSTYTGFNVFPHKTGGHVQMIKSSNKEAVRQATNANRRKR